MSCIFVLVSNDKSNDISHFLASNINPYISAITGTSIIIGLIISFIVFFKKTIVSINLKRLTFYEWKLKELEKKLKVDECNINLFMNFKMKRFWNKFKKDKYEEDFLKIFELEVDIDKRNDVREILINELNIRGNIRLFILLTFINKLLLNLPKDKSSFNFYKFVEEYIFILTTNKDDLIKDILNNNNDYINDYHLEIKIEFFYLDFVKIIFLKKYCYKFNLNFIPVSSKNEDKRRVEFIYRGNSCASKREIEYKNNINVIDEGYYKMKYEDIPKNKKYKDKYFSMDFTKDINDDLGWQEKQDENTLENLTKYLRNALSYNNKKNHNLNEQEILYYFVSKIIVLYSFGISPKTDVSNDIDKIFIK